jgi:3-oxoacyl-ACP reductase-like protein
MGYCIGFQLEKLTFRKLFGNYIHNITSHATMQNRIINGRSSNVEEQERVFKTIKNITKGASSNHPNQLIGDILVRMKAEGKLKDYQNVVLNQLKQVTKLANALPSFGNSIFSHAFFVKHSNHGKLTWKTLVITFSM